MRLFQHGYPKVSRRLVYGVDIRNGDPDLSSGRVLARLALRQVEHHVLPGSEVPPRHVVMQGLVSEVLMRLVI